MESKDQQLLEEAYSRVKKKSQKILVRGVGVIADDFQGTFDELDDFSEGSEMEWSELFDNSLMRVSPITFQEGLEGILYFAEIVTRPGSKKKQKMILDQVKGILTRLNNEYRPAEWLMWPADDEGFQYFLGFVDKHNDLRNSFPELKGIL